MDNSPNSALMTIKDGGIISLVMDDAAGWMATTTAIVPVISVPVSKNAAKTFNINGQQVDSSYHGIVIKDGKKVMQ